jgi:hypothetical protein
MLLKIIVEVIGWIGALLILGAYALQMMGRIAASTPLYQWMNLVGSIALIINGAWNGAFPSMFLNVIWLMIALYALVRGTRPRAT